MGLVECPVACRSLFLAAWDGLFLGDLFWGGLFLRCVFLGLLGEILLGRVRLCVGSLFWGGLFLGGLFLGWGWSYALWRAGVYFWKLGEGLFLGVLFLGVLFLECLVGDFPVGLSWGGSNCVCVVYFWVDYF